MVPQHLRPIDPNPLLEPYFKKHILPKVKEHLAKRHPYFASPSLKFRLKELPVMPVLPEEMMSYSWYALQAIYSAQDPQIYISIGKARTGPYPSLEHLKFWKEKGLRAWEKYVTIQINLHNPHIGSVSKN
jgi:hypothetical protein